MIWASARIRPKMAFTISKQQGPVRFAASNKVKTQNGLHFFQTARLDKVWASKIAIRPKMAFVF